MATLAVISDTHGLLRPEVRPQLHGVDGILHAGDLDDQQTLRRLHTIGKVTAVRGNSDRGAWAHALPEFEMLTIEGHTICVVHALESLTLDLKAAGISVVVFGHTHLPHNRWRDGILFFNPGSAGPVRYGKPVAMGKLHLGPGAIRGEIIPLAGLDGMPWEPAR
jgi:uncharacterized protein